MDGLEVGWLAVRAAPEWSLWAPARSCALPFEDDVESPVIRADGKVPFHAG